MTVMPSGWRSDAPWPMPIASGTAPSTAAAVVIMIGRRRITAASWIASLGLDLAARAARWIATSIIMMAFFFTMPISRMMPISAITENGVPKMQQRQGRADAGRRQRRENGDRMDGVLVEDAQHDIDRRQRRQDQQRHRADIDCAKACPAPAKPPWMEAGMPRSCIDFSIAAAPCSASRRAAG